MTFDGAYTLSVLVAETSNPSATTVRTTVVLLIDNVLSIRVHVDILHAPDAHLSGLSTKNSRNVPHSHFSTPLVHTPQMLPQRAVHAKYVLIDDVRQQGIKIYIKRTFPRLKTPSLHLLCNSHIRRLKRTTSTWK